MTHVSAEHPVEPRSAHPPASNAALSVRPTEARTVHTRLLRNMLAVEDSYAYWTRLDRSIPVTERPRVAFEQRWFGTKSEARVRTLLSDMVERFDAYPEALELLQSLGTIPAKLRPLLCHLHTQLADPIYRRFSGELLPQRRERGLVAIDRTTVARWVDSLEPGRWSAATCMKFASNLLATALEAGLIAGRRDPRKAVSPVVPDVVIGYALYLLRDVAIEGSLTDNPYLRSLGVTSGGFQPIGARLPGIQYAELGGSVELVFDAPGLAAWGKHAFMEEAS